MYTWYIMKGWDNQNGGEYMLCTWLWHIETHTEISTEEITVYGFQALQFDEQLPSVDTVMHISRAFVSKVNQMVWFNSKQIEVNFIFLETSIPMIR